MFCNLYFTWAPCSLGFLCEMFGQACPRFVISFSHVSWISSAFSCFGPYQSCYSPTVCCSFGSFLSDALISPLIGLGQAVGCSDARGCGPTTATLVTPQKTEKDAALNKCWTILLWSSHNAALHIRFYPLFISPCSLIFYQFLL